MLIENASETLLESQPIVCGHQPIADNDIAFALTDFGQECRSCWSETQAS